MKSKPLWAIEVLIVIFSGACLFSTVSSAPQQIAGVTPTVFSVDSIEGKIIPEDTFSPHQANTKAPDKILQEIQYFGTGGGRIVPFEYCKNPDKLIPYSKPTIVMDPVDTELMFKSEFVTCGWPRNEPLNGTITYPDGRVETYQLITSYLGAGVLSFRPTLGDPEGIYKFVVTDQTTIFESNAYLRFPVVPRLYELNDSRLLFYNFSPGETIRLFMYTPNYPEKPSRFYFAGWKEYVMDENGSLLINTSEDDGYFVAVTLSGLELSAVTPESTLPNAGLTIQSDMGTAMDKIQEHYQRSQLFRSCQNKILTRLMPAYGSYQGIQVKSIRSSLVLYSQPRYTARAKQEVALGEILTIESGPYCYENALWWEVAEFDSKNQSERTLEGYLTEVDSQESYYLEQVQAAIP